MKSKAKAQWYQSKITAQPVMPADLAKENKAFLEPTSNKAKACVILHNELVSMRETLGLDTEKGK